jgi:hypothetical protein
MYLTDIRLTRILAQIQLPDAMVFPHFCWYLVDYQPWLPRNVPPNVTCMEIVIRKRAKGGMSD